MLLNLLNIQDDQQEDQQKKRIRDTNVQKRQKKLLG